jgi:hypothetical protein
MAYCYHIPECAKYGSSYSADEDSFCSNETRAHYNGYEKECRNFEKRDVPKISSYIGDLDSKDYELE